MNREDAGGILFCVAMHILTKAAWPAGLLLSDNGIPS